MARKKYPEPFKRGARYYFTAREGKKRINVATGLTGKENARDFIRDYTDKRASGTGDTFKDYSKPFFIWETCPRVARRLDEGGQIGRTHVRKSRSWLDKWVLSDPIFPGLLMRDISRGDLLDLRKRLRERITGTNTLNKCVTTVKTILSEAAFRGDIRFDPGSRIGNIKYEQRERGTFDIGEVRAILQARPGDMATSPLMDAAITMLFCTGMRVGELRALRWGDVDLDSGRARIVKAFQDSTAIGPVKWNKPREIVLAALVLERLRTWRAESEHASDEDFILANIDGDAVGIEGLKNAFARTLEAAEKDKKIGLKIGERWLTPHACRHTLNTALLAAGLSPLLVQTYLGWSSQEARILTRVQAQYTHLQLLRLEDVAKAIEKMCALKPSARDKKTG